MLIANKTFSGPALMEVKELTDAGLRELTDGWARVMRTPFESAGADVRSL